MKTPEQLQVEIARKCLFRAEIGDMVECYADRYGALIPQSYFLEQCHDKKLFPVIGIRPNTSPILGSDISVGEIFSPIANRKYFYNYTWIKDFGTSRYIVEIFNLKVIARIIKKKS
jgi:hypothetical protein